MNAEDLGRSDPVNPYSAPTSTEITSPTPPGAGPVVVRGLIRMAVHHSWRLPVIVLLFGAHSRLTASSLPVRLFSLFATFILVTSLSAPILALLFATEEERPLIRKAATVAIGINLVLAAIAVWIALF